MQNRCTINIVSKRFTITVPDSLFEELEEWAESQGRPTANLAAFLVEVGVKNAKDKGDFVPTKSRSPKKDNEK